MKLISAVIIAIALSVPIVVEKIKIRSQYNPGFEDEEEASK